MNGIFSRGPLLAAFGLTAHAVSLTPPVDSGSFTFREPAPTTYEVVPFARSDLGDPEARRWLTARPTGSSRGIQLGDRIVLGVQSPPEDWSAWLQDRPLALDRVLAPDLVILQAPDAWTAAAEAAALASRDSVWLAHPVRRRPIRRHGPYAGIPNDPRFSEQWYHENRDANGQRLGVDLNARAAWPFARGEGVVLAVTDDGVEFTHPEFAARAVSSLNRNFLRGTTNGMPESYADNHGTEVAGFAVATGNNRRGILGVAPTARLASWIIYSGPDSNFAVATEEQLADMFVHRSDVVQVQNHSWGNADPTFLALTVVEDLAVSNAVTFGRGGLGVVMVRSAGNREWDSLKETYDLMDANEDGYGNDPRAVAVGAVGAGGRAAGYSKPGACVLVAAPGGYDPHPPPGAASDPQPLITTDRQGSAGDNPANDGTDSADYWASFSLRGTSFSAPQVAGVAALVLSANPQLGYRDVQQVLLLSARHFDLLDPGLVTNGAGLLVSHHVGFGIPDAGQAVRLALSWSNRPLAHRRSFTSAVTQPVPDDGLRVEVTGSGIPSLLTSIPATPSLGPHIKAPTANLPIVDLGYATSDIAQDLTGKAALIERGPSTAGVDAYFYRKIERAAAAGAVFVVLFNNLGTTERQVMAATDFVPIPAVMIGQNAGRALRGHLATDPTTQARLNRNGARHDFDVTETLCCEQVGVRLSTTHPRRGDLRVTLGSPAGTCSVLQQLNNDISPLTSWTYWSVHHFGEPSAGRWTVEVSDESPSSSGSVTEVALTLLGRPILDGDQDGLDDAWEQRELGSLDQGPLEDPDADGQSNGREQLAGTLPSVRDTPLELDLSRWDDRLLRLSWPGAPGVSCEVSAGADSAGGFAPVTNLPSRLPETEWFLPRTNLGRQFFRVREAP